MASLHIIAVYYSSVRQATLYWDSHCLALKLPKMKKKGPCDLNPGDVGCVEGCFQKEC